MESWALLRSCSGPCTGCVYRMRQRRRSNTTWSWLVAMASPIAGAPGSSINASLAYIRVRARVTARARAVVRAR